MDNEPHIEEEALNEYLDGLLEPDGRLVLEGHLEHCPQCSARLAELRSVFQALEGLPEMAPGRDLRPEILRAIAPAVASAIAPAIASRKTSIPASSYPVNMDRRLTYATWLIFAVQLIAAGVLSVFALPSILGSISLSVAQQFTSQAQQAVLLLLQNDLAEWRRMWQSVQDFWGILLQVWDQGLRLPDWLQISTLEVVMLLAAVTLLWVMLNGWLLWRRKLGNHISIWL
jgi:hypothetical protein